MKSCWMTCGRRSSFEFGTSEIFGTVLLMGAGDMWKVTGLAYLHSGCQQIPDLVMGILARVG